MGLIKAPFNFVPLSQEVFLPDWADLISHDIPFSDGVSGTIELKFISKTQVFVRNGHTKDDAAKQNGEYTSFSKSPDGKYFIPGTTMKGCFRSVLEIMSFGKLTQVDDKSFGKRDLDDKSYTTLMRNVRCGWMYRSGEDIFIEDHGTPKKIGVDEIKSLIDNKTVLSDFVKGKSSKDSDKGSEKDRLSMKKYEIVYRVKTNCGNAIFSDEDFAKFLASDVYLLKHQDGTVVLTGQSSKRYYDPDAKKPKVGKDGVKIGCWKGKGKEYIFPSEIKATLPVRKETFHSFETIHENSDDYTLFWKKKLNLGQKIPVFFIIENNDIHSIGLSGLYKYPYKNSVSDAIPQALKDGEDGIVKPDLAQCLFGYTDRNSALRGRVHFGHAFTNQQMIAAPKSFVASSPKPSYYPIYVKDGKNWDFANEISGRKRYPTRNQEINVDVAEMKDSLKQKCQMLGKGTLFNETITFHNLKPAELGALLSAITFHGMQNNCYHNIGFGKALGYGKIMIQSYKLRFVDNPDVGYYLSAYENMMVHNIPGWLQSSQLKELFSMASGIPMGKDSEFKYMKMDTDRNANEFLQAKKFGESLKSYTDIAQSSLTIDSVEGKQFDGVTDKEYEERVAKIAADEQAKKEEQSKAYGKLDFKFLANTKNFKMGWDQIKSKLEKCGLSFNYETFNSLPDENKENIMNFVNVMFERKDSKWGSKNGDFAKDFAKKEVFDKLKVNK